VICENEFGVELEAKVSDMWTPSDNSVFGTGEVGGVAGQSYLNNIASVLLIFTRSFHLVKYLCSRDMAWLSRRAMVSVRQD
jgi:hypothetical protein